MKRFFFAICVLCFASCSSTKDPSTLRLAFSVYPTTLDPRKSGDFTSSTLICLLFEGLMRCKEGSEIEPGLATSVEISSDQKTYIFHLRESYWSDGHPVTAQDFEKSWKKILQPGFPALASYLLFPIKNGEKRVKGLAPAEEVGVWAVDEKTLQVELERPTPYFLSLTAFPLFLPVPSHIDEPFAEWNMEKNQIVCNGPFSIQKIVPNAEIELKKNPFFWNPSLTQLDKIHISIIPDETTALHMFERKELDWLGIPLSPLPLDALPHLRKKAEIRFLPMAASTFCTFNTETFPFHNLALRKAFSCAIDRESLMREIAQNDQIPALSCLPPTLYGKKVQTPLFKSDREEAKKHLKQALEELSIEPADLRSLTLYYKPGQIDKRLAQAMQTQWLDALGIEIRIEQIDQKTHFNRLHERNYQLALTSWIAQFHDPSSLLNRFIDKKNPKNFPGWENETYVRLLEQASLSTHSDERLRQLEAAEEILADATIIAPIFHWCSPSLFHPRLKNFTTTSSGGVLFERCSIDEKIR